MAAAAAAVAAGPTGSTAEAMAAAAKAPPTDRQEGKIEEKGETHWWINTSAKESKGMNGKNKRAPIQKRKRVPGRAAPINAPPHTHTHTSMDDVDETDARSPLSLYRLKKSYF